MPRDPSGTYTAPSNSFNPAIDQTVIAPTDWNATLADLSSAMTDSLSRTAQGGMSADLDMNNNDINEIKTAVFQGSTSGNTTVQATAIAGTTTLTLPAATDTLVGKATTDTLTNKTLTAPVISTITNTGTLTLPASTDTLVGRNTTDTLTNKTLTSPTLNSPTLVTPSLGVATAASLAINGATIGSNGIAVNGSSNFAGAMIVQSASASALTAGAGGALNPALQVDASAGSAATGIKVTASAAAGGVAVAAISSGTNENMTINAKGSGTIAIAGSSTGNVSIGRALVYGGVTLNNAVTGTGNMVLSTSPSITTPNLIGTTAANNANAGSVGEYIESNTAAPGIASGATGVSKNLTSITLSAGDWDVQGTIGWVPANTTTLTTHAASISLVTDTADVTFGRNNLVTLPTAVTGVGNTTSSNVVMTCRFNVSVSTTVFLVGTASFATSTLTMYGNLRARRVR